jgi:thiopurine S-methyltransferase
MQAQFWHDRWHSGQIGFHQSEVERSLEMHWPTLGPAADSAVLVPLCGKSLDLTWLRQRGHFVTGVELSLLALEAYCTEQHIDARRRMQGGFEVFEARNLRLFCADLFALSAADLGDVAAVYDRAALISWAPGSRADYVRKMTELTRAGTQTLLIVLEYEQPEMQGPPFSVSAADIESCYGSHHSIEELSRQHILDREPRLRAKGLRDLQQVCYRLTRL